MESQTSSIVLDRQSLMKEHQGLVHNIAWQIHQKLRSRRIELEDLVAYGQLGLAQAAERFDPGRDNQFTTFAYHRIRGAVFDGLKKLRWFNAADYHASRYESVAHEVMETERDEATGLAANAAHWFTDVSARLAVVYLASGLEGDGDRAAPQLEDRDAVMPEEHAAMGEMRCLLRERMAELPGRLRDLVQYTYFEGMSIKAAGERLGISKSYASRLHDKALRLLAQALRVGEVVS